MTLSDRVDRSVGLSVSRSQIQYHQYDSDVQFEASDNKAAIVGYSAAAIGALWFSEW